MRWLLIPLLSACTTEESTWSSALDPVDDWDPAAVLIDPGVGNGDVLLPARLVNSFGAAIPGNSISITTDPVIPDAPVSVDLDAFGYAWLDINPGVAENFQVTVTSSADGASTGTSATGTSLGAAPQQLPLPWQATDFDADSPSFAAASSSGMAVAVDTDIWWVSGQPGQPSHVVAHFPGAVQGLWAAHIDQDGVLDLVAWSGPQLILLRGHPQGGYAWGGAWQSAGDDVTGVSAADVDSDLDTDLVVSISGENDGVIQILEGDGAWGFEPTEPLLLDHPIGSVTAGDEDLDGRPDVTLINSKGGSIRRYVQREDGWAGGSPPELSGYDAAEGSYLMPLADLKDDGADEIVVIGAPGSAQDLVFYVVADQIRYPQTFGQFYPALADMNGDGAVDIMAKEDDTLHMVRWDPTQLSFMADPISRTGATGPIAAGDMDLDGIPELGVASGPVSWYPGAIATDGGWARRDAGWTSWTTTLQGPVLVEDLDDDGWSDVVSFTESGSQLTLTNWMVTQDDGGQMAMTVGDRVNLGAGSEGLGLVRCGDDVYALVKSSSLTNLMHILYTESGDTMVATTAQSITTAGTMLSCGGGDDDPVVAVADTTGTYNLYDAELSAMGSGSAGTAQDIAVIQTAAGVDVASCATAGCSVLAVDLDDDGVDEIVTGGDQVTLEMDGASTELAASGLLSLGDFDGDGALDVIAHDTEHGRVQIMRALTNGLAAPLTLLTDQVATGAAYLGNLEGDALPELLVVDENGRLVQSGPSPSAP